MGSGKYQELGRVVFFGVSGKKELGTISENEPIKMNPSTWLVCLHMNDDQKTATRKKLSVFRYLSHFHRQWVHESRSMEKALR